MGVVVGQCSVNLGQGQFVVGCLFVRRATMEQMRYDKIGDAQTGAGNARPAIAHSRIG